MGESRDVRPHGKTDAITFRWVRAARRVFFAEQSCLCPAADPVLRCCGGLRSRNRVANRVNRISAKVQ